jgi:hypothetical protein
MRRFLFHGLVAVLAAAGIGVVAGGGAHALVQCNGVINGQTINDNVFVPPGPACDINSSTINGSVIVAPGGDLTITGSNISGGVTATNPLFIGITVSSQNTTIGGAVTISGASSAHQSFICGHTVIGGSLYLTKNVGLVFVGDARCGGNTVKGSVNISGNSGHMSFDGNLVQGSVTAQNNGGGGEIEGNRIFGALVAANNSPPYTVSGNTVSGGCINQTGPTC